MSNPPTLPAGAESAKVAAKFTPGPWHVRTLDGSIGTIDAAHVTVAQAQEVSATDRNASHAERIANARLIAAAPELLAACEAVSAHYSGSLDRQPAFVGLARAAIAKAKGEA